MANDDALLSIPSLAPIETTNGFRCPYCNRFFAALVGVRVDHIRAHVAGCVPLTVEQADAVLNWAAERNHRHTAAA